MALEHEWNISKINGQRKITNSANYCIFLLKRYLLMAITVWGASPHCLVMTLVGGWPLLMDLTFGSVHQQRPATSPVITTQ